MGLYDDLREEGYLDPRYGVVSIYRFTEFGWNCDNHWLFTAIAKQLCGFGSWPGAARFYLDARIEPGLIKRFPLRDSDISQQELAGCAALDPAFASQIESYGMKHEWCFNAMNPGAFRWDYMYARFLDFVPFIRMEAICCVGIGQILWGLGIITTSFSEYGNTSEKVYKWLQVERIKGRHRLTDFAILLWKKLMTRKYPGGPRELFSLYFPKNHPFLRYAPLEF